MLAILGQLFKVALFFLDLWTERNKEKAAAKKEVAGRIVDAFAQTNPKTRASRLASAVGDIKRLRR